MGTVFTCCGQREELLDLDGLASLDPSLLAFLQQLRREHQPEIDQSLELRQGNAIFRGIIDQNKRKAGYGELFRMGLAYLGDFSMDKPHGYGILIRGNLEYYRGEFQEGKYHGRGREFSQQHEFEGEYEHGQRKKGTLRTSEFQYQGEFRKNIFEGHGHLQFSNGTNYDGLFESGKYHGRGFLSFPNANKYEGGFKEGKYDGEGKFSWSDGISAITHFQKGERNNRELFENHHALTKQNYKQDTKNFGKGQQRKDRKMTEEKHWFEFRQIPKVVTGSGILEL